MSQSQRARVETERWVAQYGYCLACDSDVLLPTAPNTPARDFECAVCSHPYELKASSKAFGSKIVDGAYGSMMSRLRENTAATFLLMRYSDAWTPVDFLSVHRSLIVPAMIEQRRALSPTARRAGWVGCNILLHQVPPEGRIALIEQSVSVRKEVAREHFRKVERISSLSLQARGWAAALLTRLHQFGAGEFELKQVYALEEEMSRLFPKNQHVREKLRQQLQVLRDANMLTFERRGRYRLTNPVRTL